MPCTEDDDPEPNEGRRRSKNGKRLPGGPIDVAVGQAIAELRDLAGLTQEELAARIGMSKNSIGSKERGDRSLMLQDPFDVARGLGISVFDIWRLARLHEPAWSTEEMIRTDPKLTRRYVKPLLIAYEDAVRLSAEERAEREARSPRR